MTVVVGFVGPQGAVMAADSQATEPDSNSSHPIDNKIWEAHGLLCGYTGNTAVGDPLRETLLRALDGVDTSADRWAMKDNLCGIVKPVLDAAYANFSPPGAWQMMFEQLAGALLVIGRDQSGHWLLDINHHCTPTPHWERRFHTVGSGSHGAEVVKALLDHHDLAQIDLLKLKLVAYRSVATCIAVGGPIGVGGAVHVWSAEPDGGFTEAGAPELDGLRRNVQEWEQAESELFTQMGSAGADPLPDPAPPASPSEPSQPA